VSELEDSTCWVFVSALSTGHRDMAGLCVWERYVQGRPCYPLPVCWHL